MSRRTPRAGRCAAVVLWAVLVLVGCSSPALPPPASAPPATVVGTPDQVPGHDPATDPANDPAFAQYYGQRLDWTDCGKRTQCARLTVPLDWDVPDGPHLQLAVTRRPADKQPKAMVVLNFGGPGMPGGRMLRDYSEAIATRQLRAEADLISFDPRGTGDSDPLTCLNDRQLDDLLQFTPSVDPQVDETTALVELSGQADTLIRGCVANDGPLLAHVDTRSVVRDLDVLRAVLTQTRLDYLGFSYGTLIGALYADEFPQRVGRFVLDGALDPADDYTDVVIGQAQGMEQALGRYVDACLAGTVGDCPLTGPHDRAVDQIARVLSDTREHPLPTGTDRQLTSSLAMTGVVSSLYDEAAWPRLTEALTQALAGDGAALLGLADDYLFREPDGSYSANVNEVFTAVNCLDYPVDDNRAAMHRQAERVAAAAPVIGPFMTYGDVLCARWPVPATRTPALVHAAGAPPILVIGTTGDPATPYAWAQSLAAQLDSGRLLTYVGEGHTAYSRGSRCVDQTVDRFFLQGALVEDGARCS